MAQQQKCAIIPQPVEYTVSTGTTTISSKAIVLAEGAAVNAVKRLKADLAEMNLTTAKSAPVTFNVDASIKAGGYKLTVANDKINITAADQDGFFNGVESLLQLAELGNGTIENCVINDYPRFDYRGLMLDVVRYYIPKDDILKMIDVAARLKLNKLHLHLCDDNGRCMARSPR
jgi:hexosaminidase